MTKAQELTIGQRVTVRHMSGTESGTVAGIMWAKAYDPNGQQVRIDVQMDDRTRCSFPLAQVGVL